MESTEIESSDLQVRLEINSDTSLIDIDRRRGVVEELTATFENELLAQQIGPECVSGRTPSSPRPTRWFESMDLM